ncbi:hypothetical protein AN958_07087 [Leucoagaricus sp. SymC.cos]|nr:hypothetical protein AN958_07087 [Leucoagaricus sp. SymC.cos]
MLHFPSTLRTNSTNGVPKRTDSLNATQQKSGSSPLFLKIEEELHDARRVKAHGQEDDLRLALDMVINRITELSSLLSEAYKTQADLEVQLNVAKSNLALVIANNEMLEDALKRDNSTSSRDVGWRRRSGKDGDVTGERERQSLEEWQQVVDFPQSDSQPSSAVNSPQIANQPAAQESNRFFRFRFASSSSSSRPTTRPSTPSVGSAASPQVPPQAVSPVVSPPIPPHLTKELEGLNAELEKERAARKTAEQEKTNLEAELESLSQALFEEANKMVAAERIKLAVTEEELNELRTEKEALKNALRLIEGENHSLRTLRAASEISASSPALLEHYDQESNHDRDESTNRISRSRSSSEVAIKSRPNSIIPETAISLPPSPAPDFDTPDNDTSTISERLPPDTSLSQASNDSQRTPKKPSPAPLPPSSTSSTFAYPAEIEQVSPWADVPSFSSKPASQDLEMESTTLYSAAALAMR